MSQPLRDMGDKIALPNQHPNLLSVYQRQLSPTCQAAIEPGTLGVKDKHANE